MAFNPFSRKPKFILDETPGERTSRLSRVPPVRPYLKRKTSGTLERVKSFVNNPKRTAEQDSVYQEEYKKAIKKEVKKEAKKKAKEDYANSRKSGFRRLEEKGKKYAAEVKQNSSRIAKSGVALVRASPLDDIFMR